MSANRYTVLGYVAWRAGKWYLRKRLPSARTVALAGAAAASGVILAGLLAKRLAN